MFGPNEFTLKTYLYYILPPIHEYFLQFIGGFVAPLRIFGQTKNILWSR